MKKLFSIISLFAVFFGHGQAPNCLWALSYSGAGPQYSPYSALDPSGNLFTGGWFTSNSITIGTYTFNNFSPPTYDMYIAKHDPNGNVLWANAFGNTGYEGVFDVTSDPSGNCIVVGSLTSNTLTIGTFSLVRPTTNANEDLFVAKFDPAGNLIWAKAFGGLGTDDGEKVETDPSGNIIFSGYTNSSSLAFGTTTLTGSGTSFYVTKLDPSGNVLWAKRSNYNIIPSICTDINSNVYIAGTYATTTFTYATVTFTNSGAFGSREPFLIKCDANGNPIWTATGSGTNNEEFLDVKADNSGNVYVSGRFNGTVSVIGTNTLSTTGGDDSFIVKYNSSGNIQWLRSITGSSNSYASAIALSQTGLVIIGGSFDGAGATFTSTTITGYGPTNAFVAEYDVNGNFYWAEAITSLTTQVQGGDVQANNSGVYLTGYFNSPTLTVGSYSLVNQGTFDGFIVKYADVGTGVDRRFKEKMPDLFPNPNNGEFKLLSEFENSELILFNSLGQEVFHQKTKHGDNEIKTTGLSKGLYNYSILQNKTQIQAGKIVIE